MKYTERVMLSKFCLITKKMCSRKLQFGFNHSGYYKQNHKTMVHFKSVVQTSCSSLLSTSHWCPSFWWFVWMWSYSFL